jgi:hypothetical protein
MINNEPNNTYATQNPVQTDLAPIFPSAGNKPRPTTSDQHRHESHDDGWPQPKFWQGPTAGSLSGRFRSR